MKKQTKNTRVITRFAPSPTGSFHIGSLRTAFFNFLFAKQQGGKMILRIEDTDKERSKKKYEEEIIDGLKWLNIDFDGPYRQSEREDIYVPHIKKLLDDKSAYSSTEKKEGEESTIIRFKNPNKKITFTDVVRGEITVDTTDLGDFIIARDEKTPLYNLAVVIDDYEMGVTHVIRGEDHISNTPRQILIQEVLGIMRPKYVHIPLIFSKDKKKLSKRGEVKSINDYKQEGYLKDAILNFVALLGWSPQLKKADAEDILTPNNLLKLFSLDGIQESGAVFNEDKLRFLNKEHIKKLSQEEVYKAIEKNIPEEIKKLSEYSSVRLKKIIPILLERVSVWSDLKSMSKEGELSYFFENPIYEHDKLTWMKDDITELQTKEYLKGVINFLSGIQDDDFTQSNVKDALWDYATEHGRGAVLWPMRYALSGKEKSPDPFVLAELFGKDSTLIRLNKALSQL